MPHGLSSDAANAYIAAHGYNEIVEKKPSLFAKIVRRTISPISLMLMLAAALSLADGQIFDAGFIVFLLIVNIGVTLWQEGKADTAIEKLNEAIATSVRVMRDGEWQTLSARLLVPRDLIELRAGDVVPADITLLTSNSVSVNEAALTGESLPKDKIVGDLAYSGSFFASGFAQAEVAATGNDTYFGKTLTRIEVAEKRSSLERQIIQISQLLSALALLAVVLLTWLLWSKHAPMIEIMRLDLSLVIAGIPISLPTVMTLIIAFGVIHLANQGVVVRRLSSSLEELADTDYVLTDKTGTLTENKITIDSIRSFGSQREEDVAALASRVAAQEAESAMSRAVLERSNGAFKGEIVSFIPGDSTRKRSTLVMKEASGVSTLSLGAPQVIASLSNLDQHERIRFDSDVESLASHGYRALALSRAAGNSEKDMELLGILALSDTLRPDAKGVVEFLAENGVGVSMVTGDNRAIALEIAQKLDIPGTRVLTVADKPTDGWNALTRDSFSDAKAFAEILPEDKYELVRSAKRFFTVASNGDGVNDLPAVKEANVGFAVKNAVDALKDAADIVLLSDGISVMSEAFIEGRKIFARLYAYAIYRISESFRLIVTIAVLGFLIGSYPLSPLQLILIALLNDIPIISLAGNRVLTAHKPSKINVAEEFSLSMLFGMVGVINSLLLYFFALDYLHLPLPLVQTMFFLKLTVSGHLLMYVAHTAERWWNFLPSMTVIAATLGTQIIATLLAASGFLMPAAISWYLIFFVWVWSLLFMQVTELMKMLRQRMAR